MTIAFLSIGSNIERRRNVRAALAGLEAEFGPLNTSTVYQCPAVGFAGADFYNLAVSFETDLAPDALVDRLKALEHRLGRRRGEHKFEDRPIDIDLVMYGDRAGRSGEHRLPRQDVLKRAFILRPLAEIAPGFVHPVAGRTLAELWQELSGIDDGALEPVEP